MKLHREIFRRNQARINQSVLDYTPAFRQYEREYARAVASYQRRARFAELDKAIARSQILYVGDYHTLPQAQETVVDLLYRLPKQRPATLALEFVQGRHQKVLDAYMADEISETDFLEGINHQMHWVFGGWESFRRLFEVAKERGYRVVGIDSLGKGATGSSLAARDGYAARRIARSFKKHPEHLHVVFVGELHVAPQHLPAAVERELHASGIAPRKVILYQNSEEIYWQLEQRGIEHETELVRIDRDQYCSMNTPPIVCQQSFLNWLDSEEEGAALDAPEENFKHYADLIASFFELDIGDALDEVELTSVVDLSFLERLRRRGDFSAADMELIEQQIVRSESLYIPRARMVYLGNLSVNHASEEATHFLRHVCSGSEEPELLVDAFYARALEEAVGFLGSKLINHKRKCAHLPYFERTARSRSASAQEKTLARLVVKHARMEEGKRVRGMLELYDSDPDMFNALTHVLGYRLGDKLYYGLVRGQLAKSEIRELFFDSFAEEGAALSTYLYLTARTFGVRIPDNL